MAAPEYKSEECPQVTWQVCLALTRGAVASFGGRCWIPVGRYHWAVVTHGRTGFVI